MAHKYLNDIGIKSDATCVFNTTEIEKDENGNETSRMQRFREEREEYGFDDRETWSLDWTMIGWMYSHLAMYLEIGGKMVDLKYHKFDIPVLEEIPGDEWVYENSGYPEAYQREVIRENVTQEECIKIAMNYMKTYLEAEFSHNFELEFKAAECVRCALKIIAEIFPALWW